MSLNRELMTKWIEALRSGKYQQGHSYLCVNTEWGTQYCCLGVLQEIEPRIVQMYDEAEDTDVEMLDRESLMEHLGVSDESLDEHFFDQNQCAMWNDSEELSFKEIADRLESTYLESAPRANWMMKPTKN